MCHRHDVPGVAESAAAGLDYRSRVPLENGVDQNLNDG